MKIYGLQKTTLLDYPEHVAATIFTGGCNFRCPFCQNAGLVLMGEFVEAISEEEVFSHLRKRQGILDGLCITGGEPTLQTDLREFIERVKELGYAVKLDTNGYRPEVLADLLQRGLLDYVAMDIKASKENYARAVGLERPDRGEGAIDAKLCSQSDFVIGRIEESIRLLQNSGIPYEFRTTAVKGLHTVEEFARIGKWLAGSRVYYIQNYEEQGEILGKVKNGTGSGVSAEGFESFSVKELEQAVQLAGQYIDRVELRGVTA
ncbi:MAG: anaerobic ribonucleoside-triphosphate reductase activating protein [Acetatifactor sp.]|nr:anaerobic ribonucleoside-triphosphate reductase activating protein [Acetatifactor sp.]